MTTARSEDTEQLYLILERLEKRLGAKRTLGTATARSGWPSQGLYFFFEPGELRANGAARVVRVGTHGLTPTSRTTLWQRLSQHRGNSTGTNPGGGNHRGSIFRHHVGAALLRGEGAPHGLLVSWLSKEPDPKWLLAERGHERVVSRYIGGMPLLWLAVPGREDRAYLERNIIALLSAMTGGSERASPSWLGHQAVNPAIARSGLWNVKCVDERYSPEVLVRFAAHVGEPWPR